ncbi:MAG: hypothetical protein JPMHGGIA_01024 [Saprospiraceae bacterium]|nr:hypothetical protein [Saprospiraceae bacterium]
MNKIHYINVGGYPFSIDEDAYRILDDYMSSLDRHFSKSEGHKEIMQDIEARIAELLQESLGGERIVQRAMVDKVIGVMGTPERIAESDEADKAASSGAAGDKYSTGKRLYRDPYDKKIGGVCSGIAHYFGIEDPTWVRVAFVFFGFWGFGILLYLIIMLLVSEAVSPSERLAMKGKPINIQNIADKFEEEFDEFSDRVSDWKEKWSQKKRRKKYRGY